MVPITYDLPALRAELLAILADLDADPEQVEQTIDLIVGELERHVQAADDTA